jgi:Zn-dependent protease with chaperone function
VTDADFAALIERLEAVSRTAPGRYRRRVALLGLLGYAYVGAVVLAALAALGLVGYLMLSGHGRAVLAKTGWALIGLVYAVARGMWVRLSPPEGIPLTRAQVPALFEVIDELRRRVRAPRVHQVLLDHRFNAAVFQAPRLGVLGWHKNYLVLGLPLLQALSLQRFRAVLAHEFGHLSRAHGRTGAWVYRARVGWMRLVEQMERQQHWSGFVFRRFFRWYAPYFSAYSFVQARAQEYEADRSAAEVAGTREVADALLDLSLKGALLEECFWPEVWKQADHKPEPSVQPFASMSEALASPLDGAAARHWLEHALSLRTTPADTHPCLDERLSALKAAPRIPPAAERSAAAALLGRALPALAADLDRSWADLAAPHWRERFDTVQQSSRRLADLDERAAREALPLDAEWQRARLREEIEGAEAALPLYRGVLERDPGHVSARFALGRILLTRDDDRGLELLEAVCGADEDAILPACRLAHDFLRRRGRDREAESYRQRALARRDTLERAAAERVVKLDDRYLHHGLPSEAVAALRRKLAAHAEVAEAYLVRRDVQVHPERPFFVLGAKQKGTFAAWLRRDQRQRDLALQEELARSLRGSGDISVVVLNHRPRRHWRIFTQVQGSQILRGGEAIGAGDVRSEAPR